MRVLFAGTPVIAVPGLTMTAENFTVAGVLTAPDKPRGRTRKPACSPVKEKALELGLPLLQPERLDAQAREEAGRLQCDILAVYAYGKIFGPKFLDLFPLGGVNVHPSLLPKYRGPSPITAAILNGDAETGITVQNIAREVDAGDILGTAEVPLDGSETAASLTQVMAHKGAELLVSVLHDLDAGIYRAVPQDEKAASYCSLVKKEDGIINWHLPAVQIHRMVRAYNPWPKARTTYQGKGLAILESAPRGRGPGKEPGMVTGIDKEHGILVQTGDGLLGLTQVQLETRKALPWFEFLKGSPDIEGQVLGDCS